MFQDNELCSWYQTLQCTVEDIQGRAVRGLIHAEDVLCIDHPGIGMQDITDLFSGDCIVFHLL